MRRGSRSDVSGHMNPRPLMGISAGPLTDQYQGLQDIDLELELLKRKRAIIEQQQQMLALRDDYGYPKSNDNAPSRFTDYSHLYDEPSFGSSSRKRPVPVWDNEPAHKRFSSPKKPYAPRSTYVPSKPRPKPAPKPYPVKVEGPKKAEPPRPAPVPLVGDTILREDQVPTRQMTGRLELALGAIFKDLRVAYPDHEDLFRKSRVVKQAIRERIRQSMMGKVVGNPEAIKTIYREHFPKENDYDIVLKALEASSGSDFVPTTADNPELYFIRNLTRLMSLRLDEMFDRIHEIYKQENPDVASFLAENPSEVVQEPKPSADNKETKVKVEEDEDRKKVIAETISSKTYQALDRLMSLKLAKMLKKHIPTITKLLNLDAKYRKVFNSIRQDIHQQLLAEKRAAQQKQPGAQGEPQNNVAKEMYYIKILGRPTLPKRKVMQPFFDKLTPKMIKKHKNVHNLLFVGFDNQEAFEKCLAEDGIVIGRCTLSIKENERKTNDTQETIQSDPQSDNTQADNNSNCSENLIGQQLEAQITDLLLTIRKTEEMSDPLNESDNDVVCIVDKQDEIIELESEPETDKDGPTDNAEEDVTIIEEDKKADEKKDNDVEKKDNDVEKKDNDVERKDNDVEKKDNDVEKTDNDVEKTDNDVEKKDNDVERKDNDDEKKDNDVEKTDNDVEKKDNDVEFGEGTAEKVEANGEDEKKLEANTTGQMDIDEKVDDTEKIDSTDKAVDDAGVTADEPNKELTDKAVDNVNETNEVLLTDTDVQSVVPVEKAVDAVAQPIEKPTEPNINTQDSQSKPEHPKKDTVSTLKNEKELRNTPTRTSARLASTPRTVTTRNASKQAQNDP